jgi:hypothetical protein
MHSVFGKQSISRSRDLISRTAGLPSEANGAQNFRVFGVGAFNARSRPSINRSSLNGFFKKREGQTGQESASIAATS